MEESQPGSQEFRDALAKLENAEDARVLLTVDEARKILRISRPLFYNLKNSKKLATLKIGRRTLVPMQSVKKYIEQQLEAAEGG